MIVSNVIVSVSQRERKRERERERSEKGSSLIFKWLKEHC